MRPDRMLWWADGVTVFSDIFGQYVCVRFQSVNLSFSEHSNQGPEWICHSSS